MMTFFTDDDDDVSDVVEMFCIFVNLGELKVFHWSVVIGTHKDY